MLRAVARRIHREGESALWEVRTAAHYALDGIRAEWSAVLPGPDPRPDIWIPAFSAEFQVKRLQAQAELDDPTPVFRNLDRARSQLSGRGPGAAVIVVPGIEGFFRAWTRQKGPFYLYLSERLASEPYRKVSVVVFVAEPSYEQTRDPHEHFYGNRAWFRLNSDAVHPWPEDLPLLSEGPVGERPRVF